MFLHNNQRGMTKPSGYINSACEKSFELPSEAYRAQFFFSLEIRKKGRCIQACCRNCFPISTLRRLLDTCHSNYILPDCPHSILIICRCLELTVEPSVILTAYGYYVPFLASILRCTPLFTWNCLSERYEDAGSSYITELHLPWLEISTVFIPGTRTKGRIRQCLLFMSFLANQSVSHK